MKPESSLKLLEQLTLEIKSPPLLGDLVKSTRGCVTEYEGEAGTILGFGLLNKAFVAVQDVFSSKGSVLALHEHTAKEWIIVYKGEYQVNFLDDNDNVVRVFSLAPGDSVYINPNQMHSCVAMEDTWCLKITVPADKSFPLEGGSNGR